MDKARKAVLGAVGVVAAGALVVTGATAIGAPDPDPGAEISLGEAITQPHGLADGDKVLVMDENYKVPAKIKGVEKKARGLNSGKKKLAKELRLKERKKPRKARVGSTATAGCVPGYGRSEMCLPVVPPGHEGHAKPGVDMSYMYSCFEVNQVFPDGIAVNSKKDGTKKVDPLRLDSDRDGVACDADDI